MAENYDDKVWVPDDPWDTHPEFTVEDWQQEVREGNTRNGYVAWVNHQLSTEQ